MINLKVKKHCVFRTGHFVTSFMPFLLVESNPVMLQVWHDMLNSQYC